MSEVDPKLFQERREIVKDLRSALLDLIVVEGKINGEEEIRKGIVVQIEDDLVDTCFVEVRLLAEPINLWD